MSDHYEYGGESESLMGLVEEMADSIRQSRGPSLYLGEESIENSLRAAFRDRLMNSLLADVPLPLLSQAFIERIEVARKVSRDPSVVADLIQRLESHADGCCRLDARDRAVLIRAKKCCLSPEEATKP